MAGKKRPPTDPKVVKLLKYLKEESDLNKTELARAMGFSHNASYSRKEKGEGDSLYINDFLNLIKKFKERVPVKKISIALSELFEIEEPIKLYEELTKAQKEIIELTNKNNELNNLINENQNYLKNKKNSKL